jgi:hypothetical protein
VVDQVRAKVVEIFCMPAGLELRLWSESSS